MKDSIDQIITFLYNLVDRMYVGNIESIKTIALAALGIVLPITLIVQAFANFIGLGASPLASMNLGKGDKVKAIKIFNISTLLLVIIGLVLTLILYFLAEPIIVLFGCPKDVISYAVSYLKIYGLNYFYYFSY